MEGNPYQQDADGRKTPKPIKRNNFPLEAGGAFCYNITK